MMVRVGFLFVALLMLGLAGSVCAHEVRPGYLELRQTGEETYAVLWKVPALGDLKLGIRPVLPEECEPVSPVTYYRADGAYIERWDVKCRGGLTGRTITIDGLTATLTDVLVRVERADGTTNIVRLSPAAPSFTVEAAPSNVRAATAYLQLGIEHILLGIDHLLFILGLLLIVPNRWMLLKTITSFTVAHSITLAIATLGYASAPIPPLNAAIALSILFLGPEIVRYRRGETSLTIRHPWLVAFMFGLLHGFGFASGLTTTGLPSQEIPFALLLFNVGVEIGQVGFVALVLLTQRSFRALEINWPRWVQALPGYAVGSLGAFWTIERTAMLVGAIR